VALAAEWGFLFFRCPEKMRRNFEVRANRSNTASIEARSSERCALVFECSCIGGWLRQMRDTTR